MIKFIFFPLKIFLSPKKVIQESETLETLSIKQLYLIALPYAALAPFSYFLEKTLSNSSGVHLIYNIFYFFVYWILKVFSLKALVWIQNSLSPNFGLEPDEKKALISITLGIIPIWIGEIFVNFSELSKLTFLLYIFGGYILFHSLTVIRGVKKSSAFEALMIVYLPLLVLNFTIGLFANLFVYGNFVGLKK